MPFDEADGAMAPPSPHARPLSLAEVLSDEATVIEARRKREGLDETAISTTICLSGGGIRSASFGLGVVLELMRRGVFRHFDYMSTVSGGGYLGGALSVASRAPSEEPSFTLDDEGAQRLRRAGRYLVSGGASGAGDWLVFSGWTLSSFLASAVIFGLIAMTIGSFYAASTVALAGWDALKIDHDDHRHLEALRTVLTAGALGGITQAVVATVVYVNRRRSPPAGDLGSAFRRSSRLERRVLYLTSAMMGGALFTVTVPLEREFLFLFAPAAFFLGAHLFGLVLISRGSGGRGVVSVPVEALMALQGTTALLLVLALAAAGCALIWASIGAPAGGPANEDVERLTALMLELATSAGLLGAARSLFGLEEEPEQGNRLRALIIRYGPGVAVLASFAVALLLAAQISVQLAPILLEVMGTEGSKALQEWNPFEDANTAKVVALLLIAAVSLVAFVLAGLVLDLNVLSPHAYFRNRIYRGFLQQGDDARVPLTAFHPAQTRGPLHLINACLNTPSARDDRLLGRKGDVFTFSALHAGSLTTGFRPTTHFRDNETTLDEVVAISAAAASSLMGNYTTRARAMLMCIFNLRLGRWIRNPRHRSWQRRAVLLFSPRWLLKEATASWHRDDAFINVSDGGHTDDNLGLLSALRRRSTHIVVVDAAADPSYQFRDLHDAIRCATDEGLVQDVDIDIENWGRSSDAPMRIGTVTYADEAAHRSTLLYLKARLVGSAPSSCRHYARKHPAFPQQSTADQFFDPEQFDAYQRLGQAVAGEAFDGVVDGRRSTSVFEKAAGRWRRAKRCDA